MDSIAINATDSGPDAPVSEPNQPQESTDHIQPQVAEHRNNVASSRDSRPEWLPEKFSSPEDMAKAYSELEKRMGQHGQEQDQQNQQEFQQDQQNQQLPPSPEEQKALREWDNKFGSFSNEYFSTGRLSEQSYGQLNKMGYPKAVVDAFIDGQQAIANQGNQALMAEIGGNEGFKSMHDWAVDNLTQAEIDAYNGMLESGDPRQASYAVKGMYARYRANSGSSPKLIAGNQGSRSSGGAFRSIGEMTRAMSDPRYKTDSAYRKDVEKRLANSKIL
jgi:Sec-independent protein translocase protein TatA